MTDTTEIRRAARDKVAERFPGCAETIRRGSWDAGQLVKDAEAELLKARPEAQEE